MLHLFFYISLKVFFFPPGSVFLVRCFYHRGSSWHFGKIQISFSYSHNVSQDRDQEEKGATTSCYSTIPHGKCKLWKVTGEERTTYFGLFMHYPKFLKIHSRENCVFGVFISNGGQIKLKIKCVFIQIRTNRNKSPCSTPFWWRQIDTLMVLFSSTDLALNCTTG